MTSREFCYWLQGFFELGGNAAPLSLDQQNSIRGHLALVFKHEIDPSSGGPNIQVELNKIHDNISRVEAQGPGPLYRC